jgi:hypothetical protein
MHDSKPLVFRDVKDEYDAYIEASRLFCWPMEYSEEFEWRFLISLWTLLVVGAGFLTRRGSLGLRHGHASSISLIWSKLGSPYICTGDGCGVFSERMITIKRRRMPSNTRQKER